MYLLEIIGEVMRIKAIALVIVQLLVGVDIWVTAIWVHRHGVRPQHIQQLLTQSQSDIRLVAVVILRPCVSVSVTNKDNQPLRKHYTYPLMP